MHRRLRFAALSLLVGCNPTMDETELTVFAASSLTDLFNELVVQFEAEHHHVRVVTHFAGSHILAHQIERGAPGDLLAVASNREVEALHRAGHLQRPRRFAQTRLVIAVPHDNPAGIEGVADVLRARRIVIGNEAVPIGRHTRRWLSAMGTEFETKFMARVVSHEPNVRQVRAKVELGEADAAVVYQSDVAAMPDDRRMRAIAIPTESQPPVGIFVGVRTESANSHVAMQWMRFLMDESVASTLRRYGFEPAP